MHLVELVISGYRAAVVNFRSDCVAVRRIFSKISREGQEISDQSVPCGVQPKKKKRRRKESAQDRIKAAKEGNGTNFWYVCRLDSAWSTAAKEMIARVGSGSDRSRFGKSRSRN